MARTRRLVAEFIGTAWLVLGGRGSAVLAAAFTTGAPDNLHLGLGFTGVSLLSLASFGGHLASIIELGR
jgi:aquaporin Z